MSFKIPNRVRMTLAAAPGTGDLVLSNAAVGYQSLTTAGITDGDTFPYVIDDGSPLGVDWEVGLATYHSNGTVSRDAVTASSLGGSTKINATTNAIMSATIRGEDLIVGLPTSGAPTVVQYKAYQGAGTTSPIGGVTTTGSFNLAFDTVPTPGNIVLAIGNYNVGDGAHGFSLGNADYQTRSHDTTASEVGWGWLHVTSSNYSSRKSNLVGSSADTSHTLCILMLEIAGADTSGIAEAFGTLGTSSTTVQAAVAANSLAIAFFGGDGGANPTITDPAALQLSTFNTGVNCLKAGWTSVGSSGNAGITGSLASGGHGVLALNIPGV